jgi:hypothetical protein
VAVLTPIEESEMDRRALDAIHKLGPERVARLLAGMGAA